MQTPTFDPGLTQQYTGVLKRAINPDGQFNVRRTGVTWHDFHPYLYLINASWPVFIGIVVFIFLISQFGICIGIYVGRHRAFERSRGLLHFV